MDEWYKFWNDTLKNVEWIALTKKTVDLKKSQGHRGHRKVKCEMSPALVMINFYVKFNVHSSYAKQVIGLKVANRRTRLVTTIDIRQSFDWGLRNWFVVAILNFSKITCTFPDGG